MRDPDKEVIICLVACQCLDAEINTACNESRQTGVSGEHREWSSIRLTGHFVDLHLISIVETSNSSSIVPIIYRSDIAECHTTE